MPRRLKHKPAETPEARKVNRLCSELGLTRQELADALGVSIQSVYKWISDDRPLQGMNLARIENALKSLDEGFEPDAVKRFCLEGRGSLGEIRRYLDSL